MKPTAMQKSVEKDGGKTTPSTSTSSRPKYSNNVRSPSSASLTVPLQRRLSGDLTQILGDKDGPLGGRGVTRVSAIIANDRKNMPTLITSREQREAVVVKSSSRPSIKPPLLHSSVFTPSAKSPHLQSLPSPFKSPVLVETKSTPKKSAQAALPCSNRGGSTEISPDESAGNMNGYAENSVARMDSSGSVNGRTNVVGSTNSVSEACNLTDFYTSLPSLPTDEIVPRHQSSFPPSDMSPVKQTSQSPQSAPSHLQLGDASPQTDAIKSVPASSSSSPHHSVQTMNTGRPQSSHRKNRKAPRVPAMSGMVENGGGCLGMSGIAENGERGSEEGKGQANGIDVGDEPPETFHVTVKSSPISTGAEVSVEEEEEAAFAGRKDLTDARSVREKRIVSAKGTVRGFRNRVRAGIDTFLDQASIKFNYRTVESGQIVMYTTSMTVVRGTHERCRRARDILHTHMVRYEQRDVYLSQEHQRQLRERLGSENDVPLPQVFIDGQHLGSTLELEKLNESGELRKILHRFPKIQVRGLCDACGGFRFVPCELCHGSKKSLYRNHFTEEFSALRCTHCNENGLQRCQHCLNHVH